MRGRRPWEWRVQWQQARALRLDYAWHTGGSVQVDVGSELEKPPGTGSPSHAASRRHSNGH